MEVNITNESWQCRIRLKCVVGRKSGWFYFQSHLRSGRLTAQQFTPGFIEGAWNTLSIKFRSWSPANQAISKLFLFSASARFILPARTSSRSDYTKRRHCLFLVRLLRRVFFLQVLFAVVWEDLNSKISYVSIILYFCRYSHVKCI